jgi:NADPH-dependent curcumin reductase CurA
VQTDRFLRGGCNKDQQSRERMRMTTRTNRQVLLVEKPTGKLGFEHFRMSEGGIPEPKDGEALLRVRYISLDAAR